MNDMDKKTVHLILGASNLTKIRVQEIPRVGQLGEPVTELTRFGWILMSLGKEAEINKSICTKTSMDDMKISAR